MNFDAISCVLVALIWGFTNQLIKKYTPVITDSSGLLNRLQIYATSLRFLAAFLANQSGSILFYFTLSKASASSFIPSVNALTLLFTFVFEPNREKFSEISVKKILGICCLLSGTYLLS